MISGIILAAGESKRFGSPKARLNFQGQSFLQRAIMTFKEVPVDELIVVTGAHREESNQAKFVWNPNYASGMMSSIQAGVRALDPQCEAFILSLVDLPFVTADDIRSLMQAFSGHLLARYALTHPVMISSQLIPEILAVAPQDRGCAFLFDKYPAQILEAPEHLRMNINTPKDYLAHVAP